MKKTQVKKVIKSIRTRNNLTQKQLGDQYNVSANTISNWENGKSMPDEKLFEKICKDYDLSVTISESTEKERNLRNKIYATSILFFGILILVTLSIQRAIVPVNDFEYKEIKTNCDISNLSGTISYDKSLNLMYISQIEQCSNDNITYQEITSTLYEQDKNGNRNELSKDAYQNSKEITITEYLHEVLLPLSNSIKDCSIFKDSKLYLEIKALDKDNKEVFYTINLKLDEVCN